MKNISKSLLIACVAFSLTSCGTIINGSKQKVAITSEPSGAEILVDGIVMGQTPATLNLKRKEAHLISLQKEGYKTQQVKVDNDMSGWVFGNILFGGPIGLVIDIISGGAYTLNPDTVIANMAPLPPTGN